MKTPNENPNPEGADDLARREAEAQAAMDAALKQDMDPKIEAERNLRTSTASLRLELLNAIAKLLAASEKMLPSIRAPLEIFLKQLAREIYANADGNRALVEKMLGEIKVDLIEDNRSQLAGMFWKLVFVISLIVGVIGAVVAAVIVSHLRG